jgi:hypothetical protein
MRKPSARVRKPAPHWAIGTPQKRAQLRPNSTPPTRRLFGCGIALVASAAMGATSVGASASPPSTAAIQALGRLVSRAQYLGGTSMSLSVSPQADGDVLVLAADDDTWGVGLASVAGGGVASWARAGAAYYDGADDKTMEIWYGVVASAGPSNLTLTWHARVGNVQLGVQEFSAGAGATWSTDAEGSSARPFPSLQASGAGDLYFGMAFGWSDAAAGTTAGVSYDVVNSSLMFATDTSATGLVSPKGDGAGSVAVLLRATPADPTTTTASPTTTTTVPTTTTTSPTTTTTTVPTTTTSSSTTTTTVPTTTTAPTASTAVPAAVTGPSLGAAPVSWSPADIFQSDVQQWPVDPSSAEFAADIVSDYSEYYGSVGVNTMPIYTVPAGQPEAPVSVLPGCNNFLASTGPEIPIPPYTELNGSSDNPLVIYQPSTASDWELWRATQNADGTYSACWGGELDTSSSTGVFPQWYGLSASGISYLALIITEGDVASGHIDHAIALQLPVCNGYVYPADRVDCGTNPGQPAEGQWFRLPNDLAMPPGLTPFAQMVFTALQDYGAVVVDQAGAVMTEAEQPGDWAAEGHPGEDPITASWDGLPEYEVLAGIPWAELQTVDPPQG